MGFYVNVDRYGKNILLRHINDDGTDFETRVEYCPTIFVNSPDSGSVWSTIDNVPVKPMTVGNMKDTSNWIKENKHVGGMRIYGNERFLYQYISDTYPEEEIEYDVNKIRTVYIDIETSCENGFPDVDNPVESILLITMMYAGKYYTWGCGEFDNTEVDHDVEYVDCVCEEDIIRSFLAKWKEISPHVVTGWNVRFFDIPYLYNRTKALFNERESKKISPWGVVHSEEVNIFNQKRSTYRIIGVTILDYLDLYRKFKSNSEESYKLDYIAHSELGMKKLDYSEYENMHLFYKNDWQKFVHYNIVDVEIVEQLEKKLRLLQMSFTMAYDAKVTFDDVFSPVRIWDTIIYNHLKRKNFVIPLSTIGDKDSAYAGGYVMEPKLGWSNWVMSYDLTSLYPHLIMQYSISPDTLLGTNDSFIEMCPTGEEGVEVLLRRDFDTSDFDDYTMTPNGVCFSNKKQGFLGELMNKFFNKRKAFKNEMIKYEKLMMAEPENADKYSDSVARYNCAQQSTKILINAAYGALGTPYFRFYDVRLASAITYSGQLSIRWIGNAVNEYMNKLCSTKDEQYIIASDTDSIYVCCEKIIEKFGLQDKSVDKIVDILDSFGRDKMEPFIETKYKELSDYLHAYDQKMNMKREVIASKGIWTAKKRYILKVHDSEGIRYEKPKFKIMGLEVVKSSTPSSCRDMLKDAISIIMNDDEETLLDYIEDCKKKFKELPVSDIMFPRGCNNLAEYSDRNTIFRKGCPIHVRGALVYNHLLRERGLTNKYYTIKEGEKIKFIYLKEPNVLKSNVISTPGTIPDELNIDRYIDYDMQFEKAFIKPLKGIVDCINWKTERLATLEDFFC